MNAMNWSTFFLHKLESTFDILEYTINSHFLSHLVISVMLLGPLENTNCFFFEHLNGKLKKISKSSFAINDQIRYEYLLDFFLNLSKEKTQKNDITSLGIFKSNGHIY